MSSPRNSCKGSMTRYANRSPHEIPNNPAIIEPSSIFLNFISAVIARSPKKKPAKIPYTSKLYLRPIMYPEKTKSKRITILEIRNTVITSFPV
jgi:hypothetical protein